MAAKTTARKASTKATKVQRGTGKAAPSKAAKRTSGAASTGATAGGKGKESVAVRKGKASPKQATPRKTEPARTESRKGAKRKAEPESGRRRPARNRQLTPAVLRRLRKQLLEKHQELLRAFVSSKDDSREQRSDGTEDYIDYAVSSYDREFLLSLTELEQKELILVEEALKRMDRGEYGLCLASGEEIPLQRLEVQPWARYNVRFQEMEDQGMLVQHDEGLFDDEDEEAHVEVEDADFSDEEPDDDFVDADEDTDDDDTGLDDPDSREGVL